MKFSDKEKKINSLPKSIKQQTLNSYLHCSMEWGFLIFQHTALKFIKELITVVNKYNKTDFFCNLKQ